VKLLQNELQDQQRRFNAGTVPHFNVPARRGRRGQRKPAADSGAEQLSHRQNNSRTCSASICRATSGRTFRCIDHTLDAVPYQVKLPDAIQQALGSRTELIALRKAEQLQQLNIVQREVRLQADLPGLRRL